jgi:membrane protein implicated in regulation of membrane protease activity
MTADRGPDSFGPYAFTLAPAEAEAAAARTGLRTALKGGLLASHLAPLTGFALIMAFASVLALTGLISRRAGEAALILAAAAFMIQRLMTHWRIRRARGEGRAAIARLQSAGALTATFDNEALSLDVDGRTLRLRYADCEEAEDAGGLIYVWRRDGAPIIVPTRAVADADEAARLISRLSSRIGDTRRVRRLAG